MLKLWRSIADFSKQNAHGVKLYLDSHAVRSANFLRQFGALKTDERVLFVGMLFGSELVTDWRLESIGQSTVCRLATEQQSVRDCAVCEAYEHGKAMIRTALFGNGQSSFANFSFVRVTKVDSVDPSLDLECATLLLGFQRILIGWRRLRAIYDLNSTRPPQDHETVLTQAPQLFARTGRFERNGRRQVYREIDTHSLYYVDNFHIGLAAHLEVFDQQETHLGIADLQGRLVHGTEVRGRTIAW